MGDSDVITLLDRVLFCSRMREHTRPHDLPIQPPKAARAKNLFQSCRFHQGCPIRGAHGRAGLLRTHDSIRLLTNSHRPNEHGFEAPLGHEYIRSRPAIGNPPEPQKRFGVMPMNTASSSLQEELQGDTWIHIPRHQPATALSAKKPSVFPLTYSETPVYER